MSAGRGNRGPPGVSGKDPPFGVQLPQRDVECPLVLTQGAQTIVAQVHTFSNTDTSGPDEQQSVGQEVITAPKPSVQQSIVLRGKWPG